VDLLNDLSVFFGSLSGVLEGFRERSAGVSALLRDPATTFVIVTSPEPGPVAEALFLHERLAEARMPYGALIVNRAHPGELIAADPAQARPVLEGRVGASLTQRALSNLEDFAVLARRDRESIARLERAMADSATVVPHLDSSVQEVGGLVALERFLF
jgi:anion-transporting  ArsA/GET3 family ATPase